MMFKIVALWLMCLLLMVPFALWGQISQQTGLLQAGSIPTPLTRQEEFSKFIRGGFLTSGSYTQFFNAGDDITHLESASLCVMRLTASQFARQTNPAPSYVVSLGLLDNVAALQGSINDRLESAYSFDLASLSGGYTMPLLDFGAYVNAGVKGIVYYQTPIYKTFNTLNTEFTYAHDFLQSDSLRTVVYAKPLGLAAEASAKIGMKIYQNWFGTLTIGMRYTGSKEGKWYLSSDVQSWLNGDDNFLPEYMYWTDSSLPAQNYFLSGACLFANISISPFF
jgi:hypothetical protein